jgi:hypothetical protein
MYKNVKENQENDMKEVRALHEKFDEIYDKEKMANKLGTDWYNLEEIDKGDELLFSTDFSDEAENELYKRYKMKHH